jgi:hypothetical protein
MEDLFGSGYRLACNIDAIYNMENGFSSNLWGAILRGAWEGRLDIKDLAEYLDTWLNAVRVRYVESRKIIQRDAPPEDREHYNNLLEHALNSFNASHEEACMDYENLRKKVEVEV